MVVQEIETIPVSFVVEESMSKDSIELSLMDCYAGKERAEIMVFEKEDGDYDAPGLWLQFVQGCGYTPYQLTANEADKLADILKKGAAKSRKSFKK